MYRLAIERGFTAEEWSAIKNGRPQGDDPSGPVRPGQ